MNNFGFIKVASTTPTLEVANCKYNINEILKIAEQAEKEHVEIIAFPELSITGYTCQDLFRQTALINGAEQALCYYMEQTKQFDLISIIGLPLKVGDLLLNVAVVLQKGKILGVIPKTYLPNYGEFYEKRWFASSQDLRPTEVVIADQKLLISAKPKLFSTASGVLFGIEICEDVWAPIPPSNRLTLSGADIIFNLSASDELIGKHNYLKSLLSQQSARTICGYIYSGSGFGESTQDLVFGGNALIYENGRLIASGKRFSLESQMVTSQIDVEMLRSERRDNTTYINAQRSSELGIEQIDIIPCFERETNVFELERAIDPHPFIPTGEERDQSFSDILNIQALGLVKRLKHINGKSVVIGISGGLDSTLALLVCILAFDKLNLDRKGIIGVTMPGFGTTDRTYNNALELMNKLGITSREINISKSVLQHFEDIQHDITVHDATYENSQARERTQILMDLSNKLNAIVVGTGDLSELALGWATYNGDHMSMYGVNASVPKTEDLVGPYELHDFFLYHFLRHGFTPEKIYYLACNAFGVDRNVEKSYSNTTIKAWLKVFVRRFFSQQFKRSCLPDGPKVGSVSLSPRGDWRMPSDAAVQLWLDELESIVD